MADTYLQVRVKEADKQAAAAVLDQLGTNLSAVVNMMLKQIILTQGIPFSLQLQQNTGKRVHPYKVADLRSVLSKVTDNVEEVWVFGSSVTDRCREDSDLDICIVGHTSMAEEAAMYKAATCAVDIITETPEGFEAARKVKGSVYQEVFEKGLLVYKKGDTIRW